MNIDVVGRVRPANRGDASANLHVDKFNVVKAQKQHFTFGHIHKHEAGVCEIFNKSIEPLLDLSITGFNTCLMVAGESDSGLKELLLGEEVVRNGLLPILFATLFGKIGDDDAQCGSYYGKMAGKSLNRVQMQMVEISDDGLIDLFATSGTREALQLIETADSGVHIANLTMRHISDVENGSKTLKEACHKSAGLQSRAIVMFIHLTLLPHEKCQPNHSCFTVVMLPGSENFPVEPAPQSFMYQLMLHVSTMATRRTSDVVVERPEGILPALLRDQIGGNCKTRVLVCLKPYHDLPRMDVLFRFLNDVSRIKNYPILNDAYAIQLITQYRAEYMELRTNVSVKEYAEEVVKLRVEKVDLCDAYEGLLPKIEQFKRRIVIMEKEKLEMTDQLLIVEEEKLKLSKMLIDVQIENTKVKEEFETRTFEFTNQISQVENDYMEAHMKIEVYVRSNEALKVRNEEIEIELRDVTKEYTMLKKTYVVLVKSYEDELVHSDEISSELLILARTKTELIRSIDVLSQQFDSHNLEADLKHARIIISRKPHTWAKPAEFTRESVEYSYTKVEKRFRAELERTRQEYTENQNILETKINHLVKDLTDARIETKSKYTVVAELNARVLTLSDQRKMLESQNNRMQHKLKEVNEDFRLRLIKFVEDAAVFADRRRIDDSDESRSKLVGYVNDMLRELRQAYNGREEQLSSAAVEYRSQMNAIIRKHETLLAAYRSIKEQVTGLGIRDIEFIVDEQLLVLTEVDMSSTEYRTTYPTFAGETDYKQDELYIETRQQKKNYPFPTDKNMNNSIEATSPRSWGVLQKQLKEFTLNTQQELEMERAGLLSRNAMLSQEVTELNDYINTDLKRYKTEIARLRGLLVTPDGKRLPSPPSIPRTF